MAPPDLWSCSVLGQTLVPVPGCALTLKRFAPHINTAYHDFLSSRSSMGNSFGHGKKIMVICSHHICPLSRSEHSWPEFWLWCLGALCALSGLKVFWKKKKKSHSKLRTKTQKKQGMVCYPKSARGNLLPIDQYFPLIWDSDGSQGPFITSAGLKCHQWLFISAMHLMQLQAAALAAGQCKTKRDSVWSHVLFSCLWPDSFCCPCTVMLFGQRCAWAHQEQLRKPQWKSRTWCPPPGEKKLCPCEWLCIGYLQVLGPLVNISGFIWGLHCLCERAALIWSALASYWDLLS